MQPERSLQLLPTILEMRAYNENTTKRVSNKKDPFCIKINKMGTPGPKKDKS